MTIELFYTIADADGAAARRYVVEHGLKERIDFRNLYYPEVQADFAARGGQTPPALWDGATLHQGLADVLAALDALAPAPPHTKSTM